MYFYKTADNLGYLKVKERLEGYIEITEEEFNEANAEPEINENVVSLEERINELKRLLFATDYKVMKYFEGFLTEEEYIEVRNLRQSYREEINRLEEESRYE